MGTTLTSSWPTASTASEKHLFELSLLFFSNWQTSLKIYRGCFSATASLSYFMLRDLIFVDHMVEVSPICLHMGRRECSLVLYQHEASRSTSLYVH